MADSELTHTHTHTRVYNFIYIYNKVQIRLTKRNNQALQVSMTALKSVTIERVLRRNVEPIAQFSMMVLFLCLQNCSTAVCQLRLALTQFGHKC